MKPMFRTLLIAVSLLTRATVQGGLTTGYYLLR